MGNMTAVGLWTAAEWRRRWPMLVALAVMVAVAGGVATALAAGARRADTAFARFEVATGAPNLLAAMPLSPDLLTGGVPAEVIDDLAGIDGVEGVSRPTAVARCRRSPRAGCRKARTRSRSERRPPPRSACPSATRWS